MEAKVMSEQQPFKITQTLDIKQPTSTQAMALPKPEWNLLKNSVQSIKDNNSTFHTVGSALIGAGVSTGLVAFFTSFPQEQEINQVIMWAAAICATFCGIVCCFFAEKEKKLVNKSAASVLAQMEVVEQRYGQ
ncbi:hypothetical protein ACAS46_004522 [Vibrio vulnificus]